MRLPLFIILCFTILLSSCSQYQQVLRKDDMGKKYALADSLYKMEKYKKSLKLMEQLVPVYRGKPQGEKLMFIYANTYYNLEDYYLAGYQFERFAQAYPQSDSIEVASFKAAKSFYQLSPRYSLDQKDTDKGLEKLQEFINQYPNSEKRTEANALVAELRGKLEKKQYEVAKQYLRVEDYKAAIDAFDNFITDNPGSSYRKDAFYGRFVAAYKLAINSIPVLVQERLRTAKGYYNNFIKYYKDTDLAPEALELYQDIESRIVPLETEPNT
ncbi:outer membrane protein assembly factor BamD [Aequorivita lipolytica]|uniref:Outer membrane protein assembly factor BamD n=1 Tax=Aequorivita lipolytica TaxID=153267 RepID=A0A5C6YKN5_9FLAO|nr:outer membrane protein assembly factor BamD [Aequorivita lipolytica]TXD67937.1 outer membrane protein assembly factor BamD [Aequorivita lipolytica]SRX52181.1 Outer membrane protein assembly factor BamD [Aequorivita lipolytica]